MCCLVFVWAFFSQKEFERQIASVRAESALGGDFSISQAEMSSRQAMLENASDIKVTHLPQVFGLDFHMRMLCLLLYSFV